jgi:hypothetical protein
MTSADSMFSRTRSGRAASCSSATRLRLSLGTVEVARDLLVWPRVLVRLCVGPPQVAHEVRIREDVQRRLQTISNAVADSFSQAIEEVIQVATQTRHDSELIRAGTVDAL